MRRADLVLPGAFARSHGRIVAEISLDVGDDDMAVDAFAGYKPLPGELAVGRHVGRRARCGRVSSNSVAGLEDVLISEGRRE